MNINCTKCGYTLNAATAIDPDHTNVPKAGDIALCIKCGNVMIYDGPIPLPRDPTPPEQLEIMQDPEVISGLIAIAMSNKRTVQ